MTYRVIVNGSRSFANGELLAYVLDRTFRNWNRSEYIIISGHARGADRLAEDWAEARGVRCEIYPADWNKHGRSAGAIRNREMVDAGATHLIAFWDGESRGTRDCIEYARKKGLRVKVVTTKAQAS